MSFQFQARLLRLVLILGVNDQSQPIYKVVMLTRDFYENGLQIIKILGSSNLDIPNYVNQTHDVFSPIGFSIIDTRRQR